MTDASWMVTARRLVGVREVPGPASDGRIMAWARKVSRYLGAAFTSDATPWCGLFAAYVVAEAGLIPPPVAIRAKAWATWGVPTNPCVGAVLVFERLGGGHVGFYDAETPGRDGAYRVLGGNQGDKVGYAWIAKARCIAVRWPQGQARDGERVVVAEAGALSRTEA